MKRIEGDYTRLVKNESIVAAAKIRKKKVRGFSSFYNVPFFTKFDQGAVIDSCFYSPLYVIVETYAFFIAGEIQ